jgi:hypothetical protein
MSNENVKGHAFILNFQEPCQILDETKNPELVAYSKIVQLGTMTRTAIAMEGSDTDATECSMGVFPHPRQCDDKDFTGCGGEIFCEE